MKGLDIKRLRKIEKRIGEIAREFGLSTTEIIFEVVPAQKMFELMAYYFPINYSHWSRGRDYERIKTIYEHSGKGLPYEMVLNTHPPRAFIMETNPFAIQVLVIAHVYGHVDFHLKNKYILAAPKDILISAYNASRRFRKYEEKYGQEVVEKVIDSALALQWNIDPDFFIKKETDEEKEKRLYGKEEQEKIINNDSFYDLFPKKKKDKPSFEERAKKTPFEPERDILDYIIKNSPKPLMDWERDILSVIRSQALYFYPNIRTKIINEGWATYWHTRIMRRLAQEKVLTPKEYGIYALYHSAVTAYNKMDFNPYLVCWRIFEDIEERWNKGKFTKEWQECEDPYEKEHWDKKLGLGRKKLFQVREYYTSRMFIEHFLTDELIHQLDLYIYKEEINPNTGERIYSIVEKNPKKIRYLLKTLHTDMGIPRIMVEDGNYANQKFLYLKHYFEGIPLDEEYTRKTMEHVYHLWGKTVFLWSVEVDEKGKQFEKLYIFDGEKHDQKNLGPYVGKDNA